MYPKTGTMNDITWNDLPKAVLKLSNQVERIERLLLQNGVHHPEPECWFDLNQLCNYLPEKPAKATVYGWVHRGQVPYHKGGKRLRFLKSECLFR